MLRGSGHDSSIIVMGNVGGKRDLTGSKHRPTKNVEEQVTNKEVEI
jgi:hypothetical protein